MLTSLLSLVKRDDRRPRLHWDGKLVEEETEDAQREVTIVRRLGDYMVVSYNYVS